VAHLDLEQPVVGIDHELRGHRGAVRAGGQVGDIPLQPGQGPGLGLQGPVHAAGAAGQLDEPVALDRRRAGDRAFGLGDLFIDATQRAPGPLGFVLVVDDLVPAPVGPVGAENVVRAAQAACWYSCRMPPSRSRRRMSRRSSWRGSMTGWGSGRRGAAARSTRWGAARCRTARTPGARAGDGCGPRSGSG
jgi:hypothetical protein